MTRATSRRAFLQSAAAIPLIPYLCPAKSQAAARPLPQVRRLGIPEPASADGFPKLRLHESMTLAGRHLLGVLNPAENYLPYFRMTIGKDYRAEFVFTWPAHNIGRWIDALLRLENATGFAIPENLEAAMIQNLREFFNNPDNLLIPPVRYAQLIEPPNQLEIHSMRESLLALTALARYREAAWAVDSAHRMLETVLRVSNDDGTWSYDKINASKHMRVPPRQDPTQSHGRLIEALVEFYEVSKDPLALRLAKRFADYHLANTTNADGTLNLASHADHTHSYLGTLRGLLKYGRLTGQKSAIERVAATYRVTLLGQHIQKSGAIGHGLREQDNADPASTGDVVQLGLWLADCGYSQFLDDAERFVRACLLPSQIVEEPQLIPVVDDHSDAHAKLSRRAVGAYGGLHPPFWGKNPITDITCAVLHSLVDVHRHIAVSDAAGLRVNLHLDFENDDVKIRSTRAEVARVTIETKIRKDVLIRIPSWTPRESVRISIDGQRSELPPSGLFARVSPKRSSAKIDVEYALPLHDEIETLAGVSYTLRWRGDDVVGIDPNSVFFPFYASLKP